MSRLLVLNALKRLPQELREIVFRGIFPTKRQLRLRLEKQTPTHEDYEGLDFQIVDFVHSDDTSYEFKSVTCREVLWIQLRCKLFELFNDGLVFAELIDHPYGRALTISKGRRWAYRGETSVVPFDAAKAYWLKETRYCPVCGGEINSDDEQEAGDEDEPVCLECREEGDWEDDAYWQDEVENPWDDYFEDDFLDEEY